MNEALLLLCPVLLPMLAAPLLALPAFRAARARNLFVTAVTAATSALLLWVVLGLGMGKGGAALPLVSIGGGITLTLAADGLSAVYGSIIALLWPVTAVYAFDYMKKEAHLPRFYAFFLVSYGVSAGVALAGNMATMYLFFELLTLATLPLVMHRMDDEARFAGRRYLLYSITGAALGLIAVVFAARFGGGSAAFALGGTLDPLKVRGSERLLRTVYTLGFFGFGVKVALLPMSLWLPTASVAPTPVTALLHAVAVVKAGAFACLRLTYYCFGTPLLYGSAAQTVVTAAAAATVVLCSFLALRSNHLKRRLAWSTASNLSYVLLGAAAMSDAGLLGGCLHMIAHAFIKITLFFAVGAVMEKAGRAYLDETEGLARRMPVTYACFAFASAALIGVPPLPGFFSKWALCGALLDGGAVAGYIGVGALMVSAVLTALYLCGMLVPAVFPLGGRRMPGPRLESRPMNAVLLVLCAAILLLGVLHAPLNALVAGWLTGGGIA